MCSILLVDDNLLDIKLISNSIQQITDLFIEIEVAQTYEQAIQMIEASTHDLIMVDYFLNAGHVGLDVIRHTKRFTEKETPCILLTGMPFDGLESLASQAGAIYYMEKDDLSVTKMRANILFALNSQGVLSLPSFDSNNVTLAKFIDDNRISLMKAFNFKLD